MPPGCPVRRAPPVPGRRPDGCSVRPKVWHAMSSHVPGEVRSPKRAQGLRRATASIWAAPQIRVGHSRPRIGFHGNRLCAIVQSDHLPVTASLLGWNGVSRRPPTHQECGPAPRSRSGPQHQAHSAGGSTAGRGCQRRKAGPLRRRSRWTGRSRPSARENVIAPRGMHRGCSARRSARRCPAARLPR